MACFLALALVGLAEILIRTPAAGRWLEGRSTRRASFTEALLLARNSSPSFLILGNSMVAAIDQRLISRAFYGQSRTEVETILVGGGTPRTMEFLLQSATEPSPPRRNGYLLYMITPMCLNRNNPSFQETVGTLFTWRELFTDLAPSGRFDDAKLLLLNRSSRLVSERETIKAILRARFWGAPEAEPVWPRTTRQDRAGGKDNRAAPARQPVFDETVTAADPPRRRQDRISREATKKTLATWVDTWCREYEIDPYQLESLRRIIEGARERDVECLICLPPLSRDLRRELGEKVIGSYLEAVHRLGETEGVQVLDFMERYAGDEFGYTDGVHFGKRSARVFTMALIEELVLALR